MAEEAFKPVFRMDVFDYVSLILSIFVIILHSYGLRLLQTIKQKSGEKHIFIANFSLWNIFWALSNLVRYPLIRYGSDRIFTYWTLVIEGARIPFYMAIFYITIDRFLQLYLHMRYHRCFFKKRKILLSVLPCVAYVIWLTITLPLFSKDMVTFELLILCTSLYISGAFHVLILVTFITIYSYISQKLWRASKHAIGKRKSSLKKLAVPFIIVITFIFLETLPDGFIFFGLTHYGGWTIFLFRLDALSNALVYIFLQPRIKYQVGKQMQKGTDFLSCHSRTTTKHERSSKSSNLTGSGGNT